MRELAFIFCLSGMINLVNAQDCPHIPEWYFTENEECWTFSNNLSGTVSDGILTLTIEGGDPFMTSQSGLNINAEDNWEILLRMKNNTPDTTGQVYFITTTDHGWRQEMSRSFKVVPEDSILRDYVIDMSQVLSWKGFIEQFRLDPVASANSGTVEIDHIIITQPDCEKQYITFQSIENRTVYDDPFVLQASSTSGFPIEFAVTVGPAIIQDSLLTLTGEAGVVVVTANQAGDSSYCVAREVKQAFLVNDTIDHDTVQTQYYTDHWLATDALGRSLSTYDAAGPVRDEKLVGVFYYVWHGTHGEIPYDITEILKQPEAERQWGAVNAFHWWGEPEHGYHRSEDPWVIRRDLQMLTNAKVDFLFIDATNAYTYLNVVREVCNVSAQMRSEGIPTPDICFITNSYSGVTMNKIFNEFYSTGDYQDQWFMWDGKPLIMGQADDPELLPHVKDFFTIKYSWAWTNTKNEPNHWQWLDTYPQDWGWSEDPDIPEQIIVSVANHPLSNTGTSYHDGELPPVNEQYLTEYTGHGLHAKEQWERALEVDPEVLMVTQWNEWTAQRFIWDQGAGTYGGRPISNGDSYFVDAFTEEFNRDMAPMKGGHTDNFYYQLLSNIRQFKGMEAPQQFSVPQSISVDGNFTEWDHVIPAFSDPSGDVMHRNFRGIDPATTYLNSTGRNDVLLSRVTFDDDSIYFYVKTKDPLTPVSDTLWMLLLLDVDRNAYTGWEGYDYVINHEILSTGLSTLKKWNGTEWTQSANVSYAAHDNMLELSVSRTSMGLDSEAPEFYFKWADNPVELSDISTFFMNGDAAPDRRFKYHFGTTEPLYTPQSAFKEHQIPGEIQFEDFDNGDAGLAYADADIENRGGHYRPESSVDIGEKADGGFYVGWINHGEWLEYEVNVKSIGKFRMSIDYASEEGGQGAILYVDESIATDTIRFSSSGGLDKWTSISDLFIQLTAGTHMLRIEFVDARDDLNLDKISITEEEVVYPGEGEGLFRSLWTAAVGGRGWFEDSICGEIDPVIDHQWEDVSPGCGIDKDFWNARWEGVLEPLLSETYTLYLTVDNLGKLWLNNEILIDAWKSGSSGEAHTAVIDLEAGKKIPIRLDFAEALGSAYVKLEWESPGNPREVIPSAQLYPEIVTGIDHSGMNPSDYISIYPNPAENSITIHVSGAVSVMKIRICDLQGRIIYDVSPPALERFTMNMSEWNRGLYFVEIETNYGTSVKKLILR